MKIAALLIAVTAAITSHAYGASNDGSPIRWHKHDGGEVIMRMSTDQLRINNSGDPLDKLHSFTCKSPAGCVVILNAAATIEEPNRVGMALCPMVDGAQATPQCVASQTAINPLVAREIAVVGQGQHTLQTVVQIGPVSILSGWETDYTIFERHTKAAR